VLFTGAEVAIGAAGAGFVNGYFQSPGKDHASIAGVPVDLAAGVIGTIASVFGAFGEFDSHVGALSAGPLATYVSRTMAAFGSNLRHKSEEKTSQIAQHASGQIAAPRSLRVIAQVPAEAAVSQPAAATK